MAKPIRDRDQHNLTYEQEIEVETHAPYLAIFGVVFALTVVEYAVATFARLDFGPLVATLMAMAAAKVALVGWYFMHLKFANRWIYLMLVPAGILSLVIVCALIPDIVYPPR